MKEIEVTAILYEISDGQPTKLKYDDNIFVIEYKKGLQEIEIKPTKPEKTFSPTIGELLGEPLDKGEVVTRLKEFPIYRNILDKLVELKNNSNYNGRTALEVFKHFYPTLKRNSLETYLSGYERFFRKQQERPEGTKESIRGTKVAIICNTVIYSNILSDIQHIRYSPEYKTEAKKVMQRYYPNMKDTSLKVMCNAYTRYMKETYSNYVPPEQKKTEETGTIDKGRLLERREHCNIYENIVTDISKALSKRESNDELASIMHKYYPKQSYSALKRSVGYYKQYIKENNAPAIVKTRIKKRRYKPRDCIGWDDTYKRYIKKDDYYKIKEQVNRFGFVATAKSIEQALAKNGYIVKEQDVRATLHYLESKKEVYRKQYKNNIVIWHPCISHDIKDISETVKKTSKI